MTDVALRVDGLGKRYRLGTARRAKHGGRLSDLIGDIATYIRPSTNDFWALRDVSFEVRRGDIVGIIGGNGAGKSTLLKILSRVVQPTVGSAEIHGRIGSLLEVGTGFHPELTGRENIYLSGIILGMSKMEVARRFDEIVAFAGVEKFLDTPIKRYSSGMQTRLGFAVAAHLEPEILIIDEVLAVGDAEFQKKCLGKMKEVAGHGRTVLFVSHSMNSIEALCTRAIWLNNGQTRADSDDVRSVTLAYLLGGVTCRGAEWIAGDSEERDRIVIPRVMRLVDPEGHIVSAPVRNDVQITLELQFDLKELSPALTLGYEIRSDDGELLWRSYHIDSDPGSWPELRLGRNGLKSRIPSRLLNEGRYHIELIGGLHFQKWLFEPGRGNPALEFEIQGGLSDSPLWTARRNGLLAPVLPWTGHD